MTFSPHKGMDLAKICIGQMVYWGLFESVRLSANIPGSCKSAVHSGISLGFQLIIQLYQSSEAGFPYDPF